MGFPDVRRLATQMNKVNIYLFPKLLIQSADIMVSVCDVHVGVHVNNFSKVSRDTLSNKDENLLKACRSVYSSVLQSHYK